MCVKKIKTHSNYVLVLGEFNPVFVSWCCIDPHLCLSLWCVYPFIYSSRLKSFSFPWRLLSFIFSNIIWNHLTSLHLAAPVCECKSLTNNKSGGQCSCLQTGRVQCFLSQQTAAVLTVLWLPHTRMAVDAIWRWWSLRKVLSLSVK